jgi:ferrochelatase
MLETLGDNGVKNLVVVPVSFVSEHIETLEEIDMEYKEVAEEHGIVHWERSPALNMNARFIEDMADMVVEALSTPSLSLAEAAAQELDQQSVKDAYNEKLDGFGIDQAEVVNGRVAMFGIFATAAIESVLGHPIVNILGIR